MCGIAGILRWNGQRVETNSIVMLTNLLAHRGPDGSGLWFDSDHLVALGHRRLAILDTGIGGHQPMRSPSDRHVITYNGEIYNFLELREELKKNGYIFQTNSDTEVILASWQAWGDEMLFRFNGMWSFAIYDCFEKELFLARDRFGIKPLFYSHNQQQFVFASELRALRRSGIVSRNVDTAVAQRLLIDPFGVEGSERTLYSHINRLPAGHWMRVKNRCISQRRWWKTVEHLPKVPSDEIGRVEEFGALFRDAVRLRMRSDVPIGTCLSGGFDSSAVICTMSQMDQAGVGERSAKVWRQAFVASFPGMSIDERPSAEEAAAYAGVVPTIFNIGRDDAMRELDKILDDLDDIYISIPTAPWLIYQRLRMHRVLVTLDGHGADELMGGYRQQGSSFSFNLRNLLAGLTSIIPTLALYKDILKMLYMQCQGLYFLRSSLKHLPGPLVLQGDDDQLPLNWGVLNRRLYRMFHGTVLPTILRNFDRLSMAHGVEVRMPFMDWRLVCYTIALPDSSKNGGGYTKLIARRAMVGRMPESIRMNKRKIGFNSPMPEWLNGALAGWVKDIIECKNSAFSELVDEKKLNRVVGMLGKNQSWNWETVGRIWPYINLKWLLHNN
jgi:asparagine synthase (glutamine-hydrolysing)